MTKNNGEQKTSNRKIAMKYSKIIFSFFIIGLSISIFSYVMIVYSGTFAQILNSPQPKNFTLVYSGWIGNATYKEVNGTLIPDYDYTVILKFTCPNGNLMAGENVSITGTTLLLTPSGKNITLFMVAYHNSYYSPPIYDINGVPEAGGVIMNNTVGDMELVGNSTIIFPVEGIYSMFGMYFINHTAQNIQSNDAPLQISTNNELNQIQTNKVSVILSIALLFFSLFSAIDIGIRVYPYSEPKLNRVDNEQKKSKNAETKTKPENKFSNGKVKEVAPSSNSNKKA